jgi:hypothetical protein
VAGRHNASIAESPRLKPKFFFEAVSVHSWRVCLWINISALSPRAYSPTLRRMINGEFAPNREDDGSMVCCRGVHLNDLFRIDHDLVGLFVLAIPLVNLDELGHATSVSTPVLEMQ